MLANAYTTEQKDWIVNGDKAEQTNLTANTNAASCNRNIADLVLGESLSSASNTSSAWTVLDTPEQWLAFSETLPNNQAANSQSVNNQVASQFLLSGLTCAACVSNIERGLKQIKGIESVRVSLAKNRATIVWSPEFTLPSNIIKAVEALGYGATPASHPRNQAQLQAAQRKAFWRWMVAGFCMMQVMMYASPTYFTTEASMSGDMRQLLNWAAWILSLPVMIFSSQGFFSRAFNDIKSAKISMDLPIALGIAITFIVSSAATFEPNGWWGNTVYFDSLTMFVFFLLSSRLIEAKLHTRTLGALEHLISRIPESVERQNTDGTFTRVLNRELKTNDIVQVHLGEAFPADGKLVPHLQNSDANNAVITRVDESLLTGEANPINKHLHDAVVAGSYNLGQTVRMQVEKIGQRTQYGQIVQLITEAATEKPRLAKIADSIAKPFLIFVLFSAALSAALLWSTSPAQALMTAAAVLIVTCPCALSLATPAAMLASASAFVKRGILIRHLQAIESLANVDTVIFDKTGTLTAGDIQVTHIQHAAHLSEMTAMQMAATLAQHSYHPVSQALVSFGAKNIAANSAPFNIQNIEEVVGGGMQGSFNATILKLGSAKFCQLNNLMDSTNSVQQVYLADENGWLATFTLQESLKPNVKNMVSALKNAGLNVQIASGDQAHSVALIATQIGVQDYLAACQPQDKLSHLQQLKQAGKKVLMVGDGLNDGPIVASAHVSIAMGKGVPLTLAQADYVLLNGDVSQIPALIAHAKKTMRVIKQNLSWALAYNLICIPLAFTGVLSPWLAGLGMALSSLLVILNAFRQTHFAGDTFA